MCVRPSFPVYKPLCWRWLEITRGYPISVRPIGLVFSAQAHWPGLPPQGAAGKIVLLSLAQVLWCIHFLPMLTNKASSFLQTHNSHSTPPSKKIVSGHTWLQFQQSWGKAKKSRGGEMTHWVRSCTCYASLNTWVQVYKKDWWGYRSLIRCRVDTGGLLELAGPPVYPFVKWEALFLRNKTKSGRVLHLPFSRTLPHTPHMCVQL